MSESKINVVLGNLPVVCQPTAPYSQLTMNFIADFGASLRADKSAVSFADLMSLAYWCRKANLATLKNSFCAVGDRLGLGTVFHVTPSNVPVNFMFSFLFGLLSGNSNIVRIPSKEFAQTEFIIKHLNKTLQIPEYKQIKQSNAFIMYARDNEITKQFSADCNARIIWGGDATINEIRSCGLAPRAREITFADRFSFAIIGAHSILQLSSEKLATLANDFYNDTYLMDQNACSSPHLILWSGEGVEAAKEKFWTAVADLTDKKYQMQPISSVDKYTKTCGDAMAFDFFSNVRQFGNNVTTVNLTKLPANIEDFRGKCGYFLQYNIKDFNEISKIVNEKYQTLCCFGINQAEVKSVILESNLRGIDRIVPFGQALNIGVIWDGYDIIATLSRIISNI